MAVAPYVPLMSFYVVAVGSVVSTCFFCFSLFLLNMFPAISSLPVWPSSPVLGHYVAIQSRA